MNSRPSLCIKRWPHFSVLSMCVWWESGFYLHQSLLKPYPLWGTVYVLSPLRKLYLITHIRTQNYAKWSNISVGWWYVFSSQASWTRLININEIFTASYFHTFYNFTFIVTREMTQMLKNLTYKHRDLIVDHQHACKTNHGSTLFVT